jgi:DNA-binding GntR family transcriptional regulator
MSLKLKPVDRGETLGRRAREELRAAIMSGAFRPGEKITLRSVASALDISLTPAREALFNLVAEGALDMGENRSVYVPELDAARIEELTKMRVALETLAAREAVARLTSAEAEHIARLHEQLLAANTDKRFKAVIRLNWEFHFALYRAARMPMLLKLVEGCWLKSGSYLNVIYPAFGGTEAGIANHHAMMKAVTARDPEALGIALARDIDLAAATLLAAIGEPARVQPPQLMVARQQG